MKCFIDFPVTNKSDNHTCAIICFDKDMEINFIFSHIHVLFSIYPKIIKEHNTLLIKALSILQLSLASQRL